MVGRFDLIFCLFVVFSVVCLLHSQNMHLTLLQMGKCKYNIVRHGETRHLCADVCFKKFRNNPDQYLKDTNEKETQQQSKASANKVPQVQTPSPQKQDVPQLSIGSVVGNATMPENQQYKTCHVCQVMNINATQKFCNWKGLDFCTEACLAKFQATLKNNCSFCNAYIPIDMRASFCLKIGNDMRPFCKQKCYVEFKKNLRMCAHCQKDLQNIAGVTTRVGKVPRIREFCSWACVKKFESEPGDVLIQRIYGSKVSEDSVCSVCKVQGRPIRHSVRFQFKTFSLCSDICLSAFQYTNKINTVVCDSCGNICTSTEAQVHFIQFEGKTKRFCSDRCVNNFRNVNRKIVDCTWCSSKKINFDMIERLGEDNNFQLFCTLNCLSLFRVNLQAKSNMAVPCDQCKKVSV